MKYLRHITLALVMILGIAGAQIGAKPAEAAATSYQYPCSPYSVSGYNFGQWVSGWGYHAGQDVACSAGTPVYSVAEGTVVYSARTPDSYRWGNLILIQHTNPDGSNVVSLYGHLGPDRRVAAGQVVAKGQLIGTIGAAYSGDNGNWGDHLHFAIHHGGYGAATGSYAPWVHGYESAATLPQYTNPATYIAARTNGPVNSPPPPPPPAPAGVNDYMVNQVIAYGPTPAKNGEYYFDFILKNTGTTTWSNGGANPIRLGTSSPLDRPSGFAMLGQGWSAKNRMEMMTPTVAPGQLGQFRGKFSNANVAPGRYVERFTPVIEGRQWLSDKGIYLILDVNAPQYRAQWVTQGSYNNLDPTGNHLPTDSTHLAPGQKLNLKAYIKNVGDYPWTSTGANPVRLGTSHPNDRPNGFNTIGNTSIHSSENWINVSRPSGIDGSLNPNTGVITAASTINPGEIAVFSFTITVPDIGGEFIEYFNPVVENAGWMNDLGMWYRLKILPSGYHYEYVGQDNPAPVAYGAAGGQAKVRVRNSGQAAWPVNGNVRLGTENARDRISGFTSSDWISPNRASAIDANLTSPGKSTVTAGEVAEFSFNINNASVPDGAYPEHFRPVVEGVAWMPEDYGMYVPVNVQSPEWSMQYVGQRFDTDVSQLHYGQQFATTLMLKNVGNKPWKRDGANPVRLGTSHPLDRISGFADMTRPDAWLSANRASTFDAKVTNLVSANSIPQTTPTTEIKQGEIAYFSIPMKTPVVTPTLYREYFQLVAEGATWFQDIGLHFPFNVVGP